MIRQGWTCRRFPAIESSLFFRPFSHRLLSIDFFVFSRFGSFYEKKSLFSSWYLIRLWCSDDDGNGSIEFQGYFLRSFHCFSHCREVRWRRRRRTERLWDRKNVVGLSPLKVVSSRMCVLCVYVFCMCIAIAFFFFFPMVWIEFLKLLRPVSVSIWIACILNVIIVLQIPWCLTEQWVEEFWRRGEAPLFVCLLFTLVILCVETISFVERITKQRITRYLRTVRSWPWCK